ncbi:MAG: ABC transporter ATP-binding protein [Candidatus Caldatribacteriaceae bacterium]
MANVVLKNLWKRYGKVEAVRGINLEIEDKEFVAFLGPSGCGKTSTMRMIAGLEHISSGEIYIGGKLVNHLGPEERDIAMAFESYALYPPMSVFDNIAFPLRAAKLPEKEIRERVHRITEVLELTDVLDKYPKGLSGGHQQRVSLARALVRDAKVYLLDEPISHLDTKMRNKMRAELKRIHRELDSTLIYVTHDQIEALAMADKVVVMNEGLIKQVGTPQEVYFKPQNIFVADFVGEPPINFLDCKVYLKEDYCQIIVDNLSFKIFDPAKLSVLKTLEKSKLGRLILGVRPCHIDILSESSILDGREIGGKVFLVEPLGDSKIIHVRVNEHLILIEVITAFEKKEGEAILIRFQEEHLHLFDKETEEAIF